MQKIAKVLIATFWLFMGLAAAAAESAEDANYANIIDPVKLAEMSRSLMAATSFDEVTAHPGAVLTDGLAGKGVDLAATTQPLTFNCADVINPAAGAVSWWVRFRSEVTDASIRLAGIGDGGRMYIMYQGSKAWDARHRHRFGHYFLNSDLKFIQYPSGICPTPETPGPRWINITWTWEANRTRVYVDGELASELTHDQNFVQFAKKFDRLQLGAPGQDAVLDEVRFYNRSLSQADIRGYIAAVQSDALRDSALRLPAEFAGKIAGSLRAVYRVSDHALVLYAGLGEMMATEGNARIRIVDANDTEVLQKVVQVTNPQEIFRTAIVLPENLLAGDYAVTLLAGRHDKTLEAHFARKNYPWEDNRIGQEAAVPQPWTPISSKKPSLLAWWRKPTISVWGREISLTGFGLPDRVVVRQQEPTRGPVKADILAGPVRVTAVAADGRTLQWRSSNWRIASQTARQVDIQGTAACPELEASLLGSIEYDGFYKVTVRLTPRKANVEIEQLRIEIPVPDKQALLFNAASDAMRPQKTFLDIEGLPDGELWDSIRAITGGPQQVLTAPGKPRPVPVWPHTWLGNDDRGLAVMVENTRTWKIDREQPVMDLVRENGVTTLRLLPVNVPTTLSEPVEITFSLQATPIRPRPPGGTGKGMEWYGWGYFDLPVIAADLEPGAITRHDVGASPWYRTGEARAENRWWKYGCLQSHRVSPDDPVYGDMVKATRDEWENGLYTPSHIDFLMWAYRKWHEKESLDGMYFDNTYPQRANGFGSGIAYIDNDGKLQPSYHVFGQRDFLQRLQSYFQSVGPLPVMMAHVTDCPAVGYLGFADFWLDGENGGYLEYEKQVDHDEGRAKYDFIDRWYNPTGLANLRITLGRQWGTVAKYLYVWYPEPTYAMLGMYDLDHQYEPMGRKPYHEFGRYEPDVEFLPYWMPKRPLELLSGGRDIFLTAWKRPGRVRVLVSNLAEQDRAVSLEADLAALGLPQNAIAVDEREGSVVPFAAGRIESLSVPRHSYRALILATPGVYEPLSPTLGDKLVPVGTQRIDALSDNFSTISSVWEKQISAESWRATGDSRKAKARLVTTDPVSVTQGYLKIRNGSGLAHNIRRPFSQDNCSIILKLREPLGLFEPGFGPGLRLVWQNGKEIALTAWEQGPDERKDRFHAFGPAIEKWGDVPAIINWMRIDLQPSSIDFLTSTDGATWHDLASMPRTELAGAPAELIIGHGNREDRSPASYFYISFYDELVVSAAPKERVAQPTGARQ